MVGFAHQFPLVVVEAVIPEIGDLRPIPEGIEGADGEVVHPLLGNPFADGVDLFLVDLAQGLIDKLEALDRVHVPGLGIVFGQLSHFSIEEGIGQLDLARLVSAVA